MLAKELAIGIVWTNANHPRVIGHTATFRNELGIDGGARGDTSMRAGVGSDGGDMGLDIVSQVTAFNRG
jgi:hypothetical protein